VGPRYELDQVKQAAAEGRLIPGGTNFLNRLLPYIRDPLRVRSFGCDVIAELTPSDYCDTTDYGCDEYGIAISEDLQVRYGVEGLVTWYVKFKLERRRDGETVLLASLHEPDRDFDERRVAGPMKVQFKRRKIS
jgi:hypothetical protein